MPNIHSPSEQPQRDETRSLTRTILRRRTPKPAPAITPKEISDSDIFETIDLQRTNISSLDIIIGREGNLTIEEDPRAAIGAEKHASQSQWLGAIHTLDEKVLEIAGIISAAEEQLKSASNPVVITALQKLIAEKEAEMGQLQEAGLSTGSSEEETTQIFLPPEQPAITMERPLTEYLGTETEKIEDVRLGSVSDDVLKIMDGLGREAHRMILENLFSLVNRHWIGNIPKENSMRAKIGQLLRKKFDAIVDDIMNPEDKIAGLKDKISQLESQLRRAGNKSDQSKPKKRIDFLRKEIRKCREQKTTVMGKLLQSVSQSAKEAREGEKIIVQLTDNGGSILLSDFLEQYVIPSIYSLTETEASINSTLRESISMIIDSLNEKGITQFQLNRIESVLSDRIRYSGILDREFFFLTDSQIKLMELAFACMDHNKHLYSEINALLEFMRNDIRSRPTANKIRKDAKLHATLDLALKNPEKFRHFTKKLQRLKTILPQLFTTQKDKEYLYELIESSAAQAAHNAAHISSVVSTVFINLLITHLSPKIKLQRLRQEITEEEWTSRNVTEGELIQKYLDLLEISDGEIQELQREKNLSLGACFALEKLQDHNTFDRLKTVITGTFHMRWDEALDNLLKNIPTLLAKVGSSQIAFSASAQNTREPIDPDSNEVLESKAFANLAMYEVEGLTYAFGTDTAQWPLRKFTDTEYLVREITDALRKYFRQQGIVVFKPESS